MKTQNALSVGFDEITLFDGEAEVMAHKEGRNWTALYAFARDVSSGYFPPSWKWKAGMNPLFIHLVSPAPSVAVNSLRQRGFISSNN